jgi:hypothetical protein
MQTAAACAPANVALNQKEVARFEASVAVLVLLCEGVLERCRSLSPIPENPDQSDRIVSDAIGHLRTVTTGLECSKFFA